MLWFGRNTLVRNFANIRTNIMKVFVSHEEVPQPALDLLKERYELVICPGREPTRAQLLERIGNVNALFWFSKHRIDAELFNIAGPSLKVIGTMSVGYNHIDVAELKKRGIKLGNTPNVLNNAVANMAIALVLATARRMQEGRQAILDDVWELTRPQWMLGQDIEGSTVGIVGLGNIGQAIAKRLKAFEISRILYCGHRPKPEAAALGAEFVSFDALLKDSDIVIIICPLTDETRGMFNKDAFSKMKRTSILVNVARGEVVDQPALIEALETGQIWGAGLDVMYPEPLPSNHKLMTLKNCVVVPHLGSATLKTRTDMAVLAAQNIIAGLEGRPLPAQVV
ncbi:glyoxylate reductase/hydroxypyruvate reductase-like [Bacillus rossius redtenbacheri]|uniref:glyoxylate reductase/hydroxypyruvate reductase-like n=1 Tax=Bacillus rossius redtenbacheri TaxID=93214 RepID=UPI002FDE91F7